jgi:membrane associated rhomboid family serine protease/Flp pilus assembly protein TadD
MATCPCCGDALPASAEGGELCAACQRALESPDETSAAATEAAEEIAQDVGLPRATPARPYPITKALIAINVILYGLMYLTHRIWPRIGVLQWGADWGPLSLTGQWWRLLTAPFMHFSLSHLLGNMLFLWIFGKRLEPILGKYTYLLFYLSCGLAGSIGGLAFHPDAVHCGASGAVFGLGGGLVSAHGVNILALSRRGKWKLVMLAAWIAYSVYPADPEVDNAAHAAGLLTGFVLGAFLSSRLATAQRRRWAFSGVVVAISVGATLVRYNNPEVVPLGSAAAYLKAGRIDDALGALNAVLLHQPNNITANGFAALAYLEKGDNVKAEAAARRTLSRAPNNDAATSVLIAVELRTGRCEEADRLIGHTVMERHSQSALLWAFTGCNHLAEGDRYLSEGETGLAIQAYQDALKKHADEYQVQLGLAKAYEAAGRSEDAKAAAARAAELKQSASKDR